MVPQLWCRVKPHASFTIRSHVHFVPAVASSLTQPLFSTIQHVCDSLCAALMALTSKVHSGFLIREVFSGVVHCLTDVIVSISSVHIPAVICVKLKHLVHVCEIVFKTHPPLTLCLYSEGCGDGGDIRTAPVHVAS